MRLVNLAVESPDPNKFYIQHKPENKKEKWVIRQGNEYIKRELMAYTPEGVQFPGPPTGEIYGVRPYANHYQHSNLWVVEIDINVFMELLR
jgi:hypothetical protein